MLKRDVNLTVLKVSLLEAGGVDNWCNYDDALGEYAEMMSEEGIEVDFEDAEYLLIALENGGVDNWDWYSESLGHFNEYQEYLNGYDEEDDVLDYDMFVVQLENNVQEEQKEVQEKAQHEEEQAAVSEKQAFYAKAVEELEFPNVFKLIETHYKTKTHNEVKDAYKQVIEESSLFSLGCEGLDNTKEHNKAKKEAIDKGYVQAEDFFKYARPRYIELLIKNKKLLPFIEEVLNSK